MSLRQIDYLWNIHAVALLLIQMSVRSHILKFSIRHRIQRFRSTAWRSLSKYSVLKTESKIFAHTLLQYFPLPQQTHTTSTIAKNQRPSFMLFLTHIPCRSKGNCFPLLGELSNRLNHKWSCLNSFQYVQEAATYRKPSKYMNELFFAAGVPFH